MDRDEQHRSTGREAEFEAIYNSLFKTVYRLAYRLTGNASCAEDLTQEAFMRIYKGLKKFRKKSSLSTWAYRITVNTYLDKRRRLRLKEVLLSTFDMLRFKSPDTMNPEAAALEKMAERDIKRFLKILPPTERVVFTLNALEGLSYREIKEITGKTSRAIKTAMYRARKTLVRELAESERFETRSRSHG